jgi:hypothetical protein
MGKVAGKIQELRTAWLTAENAEILKCLILAALSNRRTRNNSNIAFDAAKI